MRKNSARLAARVGEAINLALTVFKFPYIFLRWVFPFVIDRSIVHLKSSLSYFELTGTLAFCLPPNKDSVTSESAADFVQTLPREQIVWSPKECARKSREQGSARFSIMLIVTSNLCCLLLRKEGKSFTKVSFVYFGSLS